MSSSFRLKMRKSEPEIWSFPPWYDTYIRPFNDCHPDYYTVPIGGPEGPKMCVRKRNDNGSDPKQAIGVKPNVNGYHKYQPRMYEYEAQDPIQQFNPLPLNERHIPNENYLNARGYFRRGTRYDGTGLSPVRTPAIADEKFYEVGYDYQPDPPALGVYDVSRSHQPYLNWKRSKQYVAGTANI